MNGYSAIRIALGHTVTDMQYNNFVHKLEKRFPEMPQMEIAHEAIGIATEAGEVADVLKSHAIYGKSLDREALIKELGDLNFWMTAIQTRYGISDEEIINYNVAKLSERYRKLSYSDAEAIARVDKKWVIKNPEGASVAGPFEHKYEALNKLDTLGPAFYIDTEQVSTQFSHEHQLHSSS